MTTKTPIYEKSMSYPLNFAHFAVTSQSVYAKLPALEINHLRKFADFSGKPIYTHGEPPDERRTAMDHHKENATWRKAYDVGRDIHELTERIHPANTIIHTLRERSAAVPVTLGMIRASSETHADRVRIAYDYAHDTEYLLFYAMVLRYLGTDDVCSLIDRVHEVKTLRASEYRNTEE